MYHVVNSSGSSSDFTSSLLLIIVLFSSHVFICFYLLEYMKRLEEEKSERYKEFVLFCLFLFVFIFLLEILYLSMGTSVNICNIPIALRG